MADAYSYPLLVELEDNKIPRLKNKLVKYFQSKKSNGGDCEVDYENGSRTAVLRFRREEGKFGPYDSWLYHGKTQIKAFILKNFLKKKLFNLTDLQNVLGKEAHQISLDKGVLKMTVHLPTDEKTQQVSKQVNKHFALSQTAKGVSNCGDHF